MKVINTIDNSIFEMANLTKQRSGLPYNIWIDSVGSDRKVSHNIPRVKIDVDGDGIPETPISIDKDNPKVLSGDDNFPKKRVVINWIKSNYDILIKHWNKELDDLDTLIMLSKG